VRSRRVAAGEDRRAEARRARQPLGQRAHEHLAAPRRPGPRRRTPRPRCAP
jgi:hypothetical protein